MIKVPYSNLSKVVIKIYIDKDELTQRKLIELDERIGKRGFVQLKKNGEIVQAVQLTLQELNYIRDLYDTPF